MLISVVNNVKIYNLSAGKAIPEWLTDRKRRQLLKKNKELRHRTELIQDLEMPNVSTNIVTSPDQNYLFVSGLYKPRVRCYDFRQMGLKFERCFDSECVKMMLLSEDWSKLALLQSDRHIEFHNAHGFYYKVRIPKPGRDFCYDCSNCIIYSCGASSDIYRLNLDLGQFVESFTSSCSGFNACITNNNLQLTIAGSEEGTLECWDARTSNKIVSSFDCARYTSHQADSDISLPGVTSMKFKDNLNLAVGTQTGQILLFDIRTNKPYIVKDHYFGLPIKTLDFHNTSNDHDLVISLDDKVIKLWDRNNGETFTAIQPDKDLNSFCVLPGTGMILVTNEGQKVQPYYIPTLGPAPRWCSFLDQITEECEEQITENIIYDDYKFVTMQELEELGIDHLVGTDLLRAYMHGFFMDIRLYTKAKAASNPFAFQEYRRNKIKAKLEDERKNRVQVISALPKVNKRLAAKLMQKREQITQQQANANDNQSKSSKTDEPAIATKPQTETLLDDDRFKAMFENPDFEVK